MSALEVSILVTTMICPCTPTITALLGLDDDEGLALELAEVEVPATDVEVAVAGTADGETATE